METVEEYQVVYGGYQDLVEKVNALIQEGWKPQGGVCAFLGTTHQAFYLQAMVR